MLEKKDKFFLFSSISKREREREFEFMLGNGLKIGKLATFCFIGSILAFCGGCGKGKMRQNISCSYSE